MIPSLQSPSLDVNGISRIFYCVAFTGCQVRSRGALFQAIWSCRAPLWEILSPYFQSLRYCSCSSNKISGRKCDHVRMGLPLYELEQVILPCAHVQTDSCRIFAQDKPPSDMRVRSWCVLCKWQKPKTRRFGGPSASWGPGHTKQRGSQRGRIDAQILCHWQLALAGPLFFTSSHLSHITDEVLRQFNEETSRQQADWRSSFEGRLGKASKRPRDPGRALILINRRCVRLKCKEWRVKLWSNRHSVCFLLEWESEVECNFFHEKANANFLQIGQKWKQIAAYVHIWAFRHSRVSAEPQDSLVWLRCSTP